MAMTLVRPPLLLFAAFSLEGLIFRVFGHLVAVGVEELKRMRAAYL